MVMVMETPSPQNVGLQFVRQYYTVLNQAPEHLHRFYSSNSSFVHGGIDCPGKPVPVHPSFGQQEIHKKIMQLNFRDCHAKIRLVDSQATLGDGVVVQVTGELSNNGQPMRRFMQTFVLALQSPRKYYVHNDILRYQDEVFPDEDDNDLTEGTVETEGEDDNSEVVTNATNSVQDVAMSHYYNPRAVNNGTTHIDDSQVATSLNTVTTPVTPVMSAAVVPPTPVSVPQMPLAPMQAPSPPQQQQQLPPVVQASPEPENNVLSDNEKNDYSSQGEEDYQEKSMSKSPEPVELVEPAPDEPRTYATMVSKNTSVSFGSSPAAATNSPGTMTSGAHKAPFNIPNNQSPLKPDHARSDAGGFIPPQQQKPPRPKMNVMRGGGPSTFTMPPRERIASTRSIPDETNDIDRRRSTSQYPDSQQLFVGKLPHEVDDDSLREVFSKYGNVVDIRINMKSAGTMKNGPPVSYNFGFIVFDDPAAVQRSLAARPILYREHRLNVEEKKKRENRSGMNNSMRMGGGPGRGGPMMGRGGPRGGSGGGGGFGGMSRGDGGRGGGGRGFGPPANRR